jgi:leader peptidase (prepilin peptidase)/N-methyltransferase
MLIFPEIFFYFFLFLCWGSFLNVCGYRLIRNQSLLHPSACIVCQHQLAWYDLLPIVSWIQLRGTCRYCKVPISFLYPFIELITAFAMTLMVYYIPTPTLYPYLLLASLLLIITRSDLETMLISRWCTLAAIPIGLLCSVLQLLPITPLQSILGALTGYILLYAPRHLYRYLRSQDGLGQADEEMLAGIGSFLGPLYAWNTLFLAACFGSIIGSLWLMFTSSSKDQPLPFGPFLALGAYLTCIIPYVLGYDIWHYLFL